MNKLKKAEEKTLGVVWNQAREIARVCFEIKRLGGRHRKTRNPLSGGVKPTKLTPLCAVKAVKRNLLCAKKKKTKLEATTQGWVPS